MYNLTNRIAMATNMLPNAQYSSQARRADADRLSSLKRVGALVDQRPQLRVRRHSGVDHDLL
jgi:hypothetical protein